MLEERQAGFYTHDMFNLKKSPCSAQGQVQTGPNEYSRPLLFSGFDG